MAAIHEGAAIRKSEFYVCSGSAADFDVDKILQIWMISIENWIFEAEA